VTRDLAGPGQRFLARIVDGLILAIPRYALLFALGVPGFVLGSLGAVLYEVLFIARSGQTPGKQLLGVVVSDAEVEAVPTNSQAWLRSVPLLIGLVPVFAVSLLGPLLYLPLLWHPRRQGVHDRLARTVVVKA
jgi:uncharacterized RDD family membrane protein YckC